MTPAAHTGQHRIYWCQDGVRKAGGESMQFIIEAITRRDNLALLRFRAGWDLAELPGGEFCLWNGKEGIAVFSAEDLNGDMPAEWGYSRILFDGIGMHALAGKVCALLEEYPVAAVSVSDIRLGILVPGSDADAVWLTLWAHFGPMLSDDRKIMAPGEAE